MEELTLLDCVAIFRRWKKLFASVFLVLFVGSFLFAFTWTRYRAEATIHIEQPEVAATATTLFGMSDDDRKEALADQRISVLQQKVLSTASLIEIITKFNLYPELRESVPIANVAQSVMRKKIRIQLISSSLANPSAANKKSLAAIAFTISFDHSVALTAQQVTNELASRFMEEDLKQRRTETQQTSAFLESQIKTLETSLKEQEKRIADYQSKHGISRPETLGFNQQIVATLTLNLQNLDSQIATNEGRIGSLRGELASVDPYSRVIADGQVLMAPSVQLKALQSEYASLTSRYGSEHPDVVKVRRQIKALQSEVGRSSKAMSQLKAQIEDVRTKLTVAQKTYGNDHPDVVSLTTQLQKLEDQLAKQKPGQGSLNGGIIADADNPVYLSVAAQLVAAEEQKKSLEEQRQALVEQLGGYQKALIENPEAQKELASLSRDYENAQRRYGELQARKLAADMAVQVQQDRTGEKMTLINPPELPAGTNPGKKLLYLAGLMLSFMGAFGSVIVAQLLTQSVIGVRHLEAIVGVAPLAGIPHLYTEEEKKRSWGKRLQKKAAGIGIIALTKLDPTFQERIAPRCEAVVPLYKRLVAWCQRQAQS